MLYTGQFKSYKNVLYTVNIVTNNNSSESVELTFSDEPVVIETNSGDGLFTPVKSKRATITLVTNDVYYDLYASGAQDTSVTIIRGEKIIFNGYLTPCVYSQEWAYLSELELEAVDKISTLLYYKYEIDSPSTGFQVLSFATLIRKCLKKAGYNNYFYYPVNSLLKAAGSTTPIIECFGCSESNFFDDDDEATPWTYEELLTEICKFLGVSCVPFGRDIFFVDYAAINANKLDFDKFFVTGNESTQGKYLANTISLSKDNYAKGIPSLSLDEVYNKISVSASVYEYGKDAGSLDTEISTKINSLLSNYGGWANDFITCRSTIITKDKQVPYECYVKLQTPNSQSKWDIRYFESNLIDDIPNDVDKYKPSKPYSGMPSANKKVAEYTYDNDKQWCMITHIDPKYEGMSDTLTSNSTYNWRIPIAVYKNIPILVNYNVIKRNDVPVSSDWKTCIMFTPINRNCTRRLKEYITSTYNIPADEIEERSAWAAGVTGGYEYNWFEKCENIHGEDLKAKLITGNVKPCLQYRDNTELIYSPGEGKTAYLYFDGKLLYTQDHAYRKDKTVYTSHVWNCLDGTNNNHLFPPDETGYTSHTIWERGHDSADFNKGWPCLKIMCKIGDKYWNGSAWTNTYSTFDIYFNSGRADPNDSNSTEKFNLYEWQKIVYNTTYKDTLGKEVYAIPITQEDNLHGTMSIDVYTPHMTTIDGRRLFTKHIEYNGDDEYGYYELWHKYYIDITACPQHIFLQDFTIDYFYDAGDWSDTEEKKDEDIVYYNVINEKYVQEFDDLEVKINTYVDGKPMSRSYNTDPVNKSFVREVYNPITNTNTIPENHIIEKYYNHYSSPKKIFEMDMIYDDQTQPGSLVKYSFLTGKNMVIDSEEISLISDTDTIKIIEY